MPMERRAQSSQQSRDRRRDDVAKQERWAVSTNKAEGCKLTNNWKAIETAREYQSKVFDIETKRVKRRWKAIINRKVELMFAEGFIPPGDVKLRCAPTAQEREMYMREEYVPGETQYRPAFHRIINPLPSNEHELLREYARERVWRPQTAGPRLGLDTASSSARRAGARSARNRGDLMSRSKDKRGVSAK